MGMDFHLELGFYEYESSVALWSFAVLGNPTCSDPSSKKTEAMCSSYPPPSPSTSSCFVFLLVFSQRGKEDDAVQAMTKISAGCGGGERQIATDEVVANAPTSMKTRFRHQHVRIPFSAKWLYQ